MCGIGVVLQSNSADNLCFRDRLRALLANRGPDCSQTYEFDDIQFLGSVLHIQGSSATSQPYVDAIGNILLWNGEVFSGIVSHQPGSSDTPCVANMLADAVEGCSDISNVSKCISEALACIHGPYACIYYHQVTRAVYFARDPLGRRSLLTMSEANKVICIASVSSALDQNSCDVESIWREVDVEGVYCFHNGIMTCTKWPVHRVRLQRISVEGSPSSNSACVGVHEDYSHLLYEKLKNAVEKRVLCLNRSNIDANNRSTIVDDTCGVGVLFSGGLDSVVLAALLHHCVGDATAVIELINVTFLGATKTSNKKKSNCDSPDRLAAVSALIELQELFPARNWRMVHVDVDLGEREEHDKHIKGLIYPSDSHMDLNIGTAFWFASRGVGYLQPHTLAEKEASFTMESENKKLLRLGGQQPLPLAKKNSCGVNESIDSISGEGSAADSAMVKVPCARVGCKRIKKVGCSQDYCKDCCIKTELCVECGVHRKYLKKGKLAGAVESSVEGDSLENQDDSDVATPTNRSPYKACCRALLIGIGADEQMGGYGRHRTCFNRGGFTALQEELHLDQNRLWSRNLGRDDRCVSDNGREAWFPYLDEEVVEFLQQLPLDKIVDYSLPPGVGDKKILRDVGKRLGLRESADLVKRAIQFGTGIAKNTNVEYFGSNRKGSGGTKF